MDSPGSPLSELSSEDFTEDVKADDHRSISIDTYRDHDHDSEHVRPAKRQKTAGGRRSHRAPSLDPMTAPPMYDTDISSDTDGSVPGSPAHGLGGPKEQDEEALGQEQVTVCKWDGCDAGDMINMDKLVEHLHDEHIHARQKKYSCEWMDCTRKGTPHASGYALRAHMRSHTREKPFYCSLPECDRSFTRSDALAKHMRTVHETEALRPSDPVPKHHSSNPSNKFQRLRLTINKSSTNGDPKSEISTPVSPSALPLAIATERSPAELYYENNNAVYIPASHNLQNGHIGGSSVHKTWNVQFPSDVQLTPHEQTMSADELYRLLKQQERWAHQEGDELRMQVEQLEQQRREEWTAKELLVENLMEAEFAIMERRARRKPQMGGDAILEKMRAQVAPSRELPIEGGEALWWRNPENLPRENNEPVPALEHGQKRELDEAEIDAAEVLSAMGGQGTGVATWA